MITPKNENGDHLKTSEKVFCSFLTIMKKPSRLRNLIAYADRLLVKYEIDGGAYTGQDIVSEVLVKVASEDRNWDPEKHPDMYNPLFFIIRSHIGHLAEKELPVIRPDLDNSEEEEDEEAAAPNKHPDTDRPSIDEPLLNTGDDLYLYEECMKLLNSDTECGLVMLGIMEGQSWKEIADDLNISLQKVNGIMVHIRNKLRGSNLSRVRKFKLRGQVNE